jgi:hypothetical protein
MYQNPFRTQLGIKGIFYTGGKLPPSRNLRHGDARAVKSSMHTRHNAINLMITKVCLIQSIGAGD